MITLLALLLGACNDDKGSPPGETGQPADTQEPGETDQPAETGETGETAQPEVALVGPFLDGDCDPIAPDHCGFPFPSNVYLVEDASTPTGHRVAIPDGMMPLSNSGVRSSPELLNAADGFSPGAGPMTFMPGATDAGLVSPFTPEDSLLEGALTVILDVETGERVPHFAELDESHDDDSARVLMLRPVVPLRDDARYIVAIRGVVDVSGAALAPSEVFLALRDGTESAEPSVEARRGLYEDIFGHLTTAGVAREDLQIAWDFSTASRESNTGRLLAMRDAALDALPETGPTYTITSVEEAPYTHIARRIEGTITVPLYLDDGDPGGMFVLGEDGLPEQNGTFEYPFLMLIPDSCELEPCSILQYGHGLFGSRNDLANDAYMAMLDDFGAVGISTDLIGMSGEDIPVIAGAAISGDILRFAAIPDRSQQGFLNMVLTLRAAMGPLVDDEQTWLGGQPTIDPERRYYLGGSQGGIYGATYMAVSPDITRGVLAVPGQSYSLMLPRSTYWGVYATPFLVDVFEDPRDVALVLGLIQMLWDRAEPTGYSQYMTEDTLPGTPSHRVILLEAIGDHQVPNLSSELLARSMGAVHLEPRNIEHYGLEGASGPIDEGNVFIDYDFGLPRVPEENLPMTEGSDPHGELVYLESVLVMGALFLETGSVIQACDGACDPE